MKPEQKFSPEGERFVTLIDRAKAGDQQAYSALYEATEREVYRTVRAMIRSEELARDVQQEVYVYAFTHLDSLREPEKLRAWLRGIAVNQSHTALRQVTPVLFSELENGEGAELPELADLSGDTEPELTLERKETARYVNEILDDLTDGQRAVVAMYYYEELPVSEIARDLGVTPGTVKTQLFRSRKNIESAVRRLEEQGVKLLGLAPLPFLVALLKRLTPAAEGSKAALQGSLARAGLVPAAQAGTAASAAGTTAAGTAASVAGTAAADAAASFAETAAVHLGRSFFETALGKVVLGLITAAAIGGGIAGFKWYQDHINVGDVRPPETLEINLHYDTDEDLTTEPTAETDTEPVTTAAPETGEDLVPETGEDLPPEPTDSTGPTDPVGAADPSGPDPTAPTDPAGADDPDPTDPTTPANPTEPTDPVGAGDPTGPGPTDSTDPTDPDADRQTSPIFVCCGLEFPDKGSTESEEIYDFPWGTTYFYAVVEGNEIPELSTDNPSMIVLGERGKYFLGEHADNASQDVYMWRVTISGGGMGRLFVDHCGERVRTITINNPEYPDKLLRWEVFGTETETGEIDCREHLRFSLTLVIQGWSKPVLFTDDPEALSIEYDTELFSSDLTSQQRMYRWSINVQKREGGTADLRLTLNGKPEHEWVILLPQSEEEEMPSEQDAYHDKNGGKNK